MTLIAQNLESLRSRLPKRVELVAVSKFHPVEAIRQAYDAGQRIFGENRVQELVAKAPQLPDDVRWHMIGHLQRNKVRQLMPHVAMIESVDSVELLRLIEKEAARIGRNVDVLLQLHVAQEQTKTGFAIDELLAALATEELTGLEHVRLCGLMAMATHADDASLIAQEFTLVRDTFRVVKEEFFPEDEAFSQISMGMSDDWPIAVECGATLIRVGSSIFGPREY